MYVMRAWVKFHVVSEGMFTETHELFVRLSELAKHVLGNPF